jgi:predicted SnoaL-like aldol condensation-catalyzing enzyme
MTSDRKGRICALLKGIETGDEAAVAVVNPDKYIQHNPQTKEGGEGLAVLFKRLSKTSPHVNIVRIFEDGDFVFGHTEYEFSTSRVGFEVFRFEGDQTVEHWDNIQSRKGPNSSGHTMVDGPTVAIDHNLTEPNRRLVQSFVDEILVNRELHKLEGFVNNESYTEHNPKIGDGITALSSALSAHMAGGGFEIQYHKNHRLLAEGSFVLSVSEGTLKGIHTAFFDLFRVTQGQIVEHWDTTEAVPARAEWKNDNGKFQGLMERSV